MSSVISQLTIEAETSNDVVESNNIIAASSINYEGNCREPSREEELEVIYLK